MKLPDCPFRIACLVPMLVVLGAMWGAAWEVCVQPLLMEAAYIDSK